MSTPLKPIDDVHGSSAAIRETLDRIFSSSHFRDSPQLIAFLRYVTEETLAGRADNLKGYSIALEALGRSPSFDPQQDPIVRVQATRLRRALLAYYAQDGAQDPVMIELERGGYAPRFIQRKNAASPSMLDDLSGLEESAPVSAAARATSVASPAAKLPLGRFLLMILGAGMVAAIMVAGFLFATGALRLSPSDSTAATDALDAKPTRRSDSPIVVLDRRSIDANASAQQSNVREDFLNDLALALGRFDDILVVRRDDLKGRQSRSLSTELLYQLHVSVDPSPDGTTDIAVELFHADSETLVWSQTFEKTNLNGNAARDAAPILRMIASQVAQPYGAIFADAEKRLKEADQHSPEYTCLIVSFRYWNTYAAKEHAAALQCLSQALERVPGSSALHAAMAGLLVDAYRQRFDVGAFDIRDRALEEAQKAVSLAPGSARSHQALMSARFAKNDFSNAIQAGEHALRLNPFDSDIVADLGARFIQLGDLQKGRAMLDDASLYAPSRPDWYEFFYFVVSTALNDAIGMRGAGEAITSKTYPFGLIARASAARIAGNPQQAASFYQELVAVAPELDSDPRAYLDRAYFVPFIADSLIDELKKLKSLSTG
jgi:tetratricopeptide (TPR) repeat protein